MLSNHASLTVLLIALAAGPAAAGDSTGTGAVAHTITIIDRDVIRPSTLSMRSGDVLEFSNYSAQPMLLVFTEPRDPVDKVRCRPAHASAPSASADLMLDDSGEPQLLTVIPPGRSASSCSLEPGRYAFLMRRVSRDVRAPDDTLGTKGVITVQP
jgi:hypothetical protein